MSRRLYPRHETHGTAMVKNEIKSIRIHVQSISTRKMSNINLIE